jgi:hypothetical protein
VTGTVMTHFRSLPIKSNAGRRFSHIFANITIRYILQLKWQRT